MITEDDIEIRVRALRHAGINPNERPHHAVQHLYELGLGFSGRPGTEMADLMHAVQTEYARAAERRAGALDDLFALDPDLMIGRAA